MKVQAQLCPFQDDGSVVVDSFLMFLPLDCGVSVFDPLINYALLGVLSSFAIILTRKREHGVLL